MLGKATAATWKLCGGEAGRPDTSKGEAALTEGQMCLPAWHRAGWGSRLS